jgi:hypothetical protein
MQLAERPLLRPTYHEYLGWCSLHVQVLRLLNELMIYWDSIDITPKPSLSKLLDNRPLNHIKLDFKSNSVMYRLWDLILQQLWQEN